MFIIMHKENIRFLIDEEPYIVPSWYNIIVILLWPIILIYVDNIGFNKNKRIGANFSMTPFALPLKTQFPRHKNSSDNQPIKKKYLSGRHRLSIPDNQFGMIIFLLA